MHFADLRFCKTSPLKLAIHIRGKHETAMFQACGDLLQDSEAGVRNGVPVQGQPVAVEAPGELWGAQEGIRAGDVLEGDAGPAKGRVGAPQAAIAAKVGQAGIYPHAGAGGDEQAVRGGDASGGLGEQGGFVIHCWARMKMRRKGKKVVPLASAG